MQDEVVDESRQAAIIVPMIMVGLFEACALVVVGLLTWLCLRYAHAREHALPQLTAQAGRMLQYWAGLVWVHGIAWAWFRRAGSRRAAWQGFAGIVYLGCGYVFALAAAAVFDVCPCSEDLRTFVWLVVGPGLAWISGLLGCGLLLSVWSSRKTPPVESSSQPVEPTSIRAPGFAILVGISLILSLVATGNLAFRTGSLLSRWYFRSSSDRAVDFLGVVVYGAVYMAASLAALAAALVCARRAVKRRDRDLLWRAGVLALIGGLQQIVVLGWPALVGGILAIRAAGRHDRSPGNAP